MPSHLRKPVSGLVRKNISFVAILVLVFASLRGHAAEPDIIGDWSGVLNTGRASLHLLLHVSEAAKGGLNATLDSLDQGAIGLPGSNTVLKGDRFTFEIPSVSGSYGGTVSADSKTINGTWTQHATLPLVFEKTPTKAHKPADVVGEWNATVLVAGDSQRTKMHVKADPAGHLSATLDSINDHVNGIVTKDVALSLATPCVESAFLYSNLGFGLLGYALAQRASVTYPQLLSNQILTPLHMSDTSVSVSAAQRARLIQGFNDRFDPAGAWDFDAFAGAGAIKSTAADMLTYLDANLHPDKYAVGAPAGSPKRQTCRRQSPWIIKCAPTSSSTAS